MRIRSEIGSEFWGLPPLQAEANKLFPESAQWYLSGRCALRAIIKELKNRHTVAMPSWCCDSMITPFLAAGFEVRFYPVYWDRGLIQEPRFDCDVLFVMDYFGYSAAAPELGGFQGPVIRDVTHSLFSAPCLDADYTFGSLRKWCGVWTGGYAWTRDGHRLCLENTDDRGYTRLRERAMQLKNGYIHAAADSAAPAGKEYLALFGEAEELLGQLDALPAAERDVQAARFLNADFIRARRRENAERLMAAFPEWLIFPELKETDCPLFVPVLVPDGNRDELRSFLIQNEIYCPVHWPISVSHQLTEQERVLYDRGLSLVCDQRYAEKEMRRTVETIALYGKGR